MGYIADVSEIMDTLAALSQVRAEADRLERELVGYLEANGWTVEFDDEDGSPYCFLPQARSHVRILPSLDLEEAVRCQDQATPEWTEAWRAFQEHPFVPVSLLGIFPPLPGTMPPRSLEDLRDEDRLLVTAHIARDQKRDR